jgi:hypothetical protein
MNQSVMNANENLIHHFYTCFNNRDAKGMQDCYAENASFSDPAFGDLNARQVCCMWEMLIGSAKNMRISYDHVRADDLSGSAEWIAYYTFSATGKKVKNKISASFVFGNGKILSHHDQFSFYLWARQALGLPGLLLGWTPLLKNKVRRKALSNLRSYMAAN